MRQHAMNSQRYAPFPVLFLLILIMLMACALRLYHIGDAPFRGDEAFAVRYWAQPPGVVLSGLAWTEPHPFGTFLLFWAWKSLVGSTEFAMRTLPALASLLGVPAMYALGRKLFHSRAAGYVGALLWAIDPNLIWHAQDARNYAIWSAASVVALALLVRAATRARSRPLDWLLYAVATALACYIFFLEALMLVGHTLFMLVFARRRIGVWLRAVVLIGVLLLPWAGQLWVLAHSGYAGSGVPHTDPAAMLYQFWPSLLMGESLVENTPLALATLAVAFMLPLMLSRQRQTGGLLLLWLLIPSAMLVATATRVNVFWPRYLLAATPAVLLPLAGLAGASLQSWRLNKRQFQVVAAGLIVALCAAMVGLALFGYYRGDHPKSADWFGLRDYLTANTTADDMVIMSSLDPLTGNGDPAFEYYYTGPAKVVTLPNPKIDTPQVVRDALADHRAVWFVVSGNATQPINQALLDNGALITDQGAGASFLVRQYRARQAKPAEIEQPLSLSMGSGSLAGYSLVGARRTGSTLTLLLFWDRSPDPALTAFVHLIGAARTDGSPLWAQDDHPPATGRDVYHLSLASVVPGDYQIEIGLYDARTGERTAIADLSGKTLGQSTILTNVTIAGK